MKALVLSATFAICALLGLAFVLAWRSYDQQQLDDARKENCVAIERLKQIQRKALLEDLAVARGFLEERYGGIAGIPRSVIEDGIRRDEQTLRELAPEDC